MKVARVCNVAAVTTFVYRHFSMASMHHATLALVLLTAFSSPTIGFSPSPGRKHFGVSLFSSNRAGPHVNDKHHTCSPLYASKDDTVSDSSESTFEEDDEEDDEVDIITQKLRRNAENGPINPMKEHDKMMKENEDEAKANINGNNNSTVAPSALYSDMLAHVVDPEFDPDRSTDEAYVESQFKELLSRKGSELSRLGPGIATLPLDPSSDEAKSEDKLSQKEMELQQVIDEAKTAGAEKWDEYNLEESQNKQSEILEKAHKLQSEIDQLHVDDCGAVLLANLAFYEAFSLQDPEGMKDVWWQSPSVMCIHPSHPPLIGSNAVYDSFSNIFENGMKGRARGGGGDSAASGGVFMTPVNIRGLSVRGTTASLVCDEEVYSKGSAGESISRQGGLLVNKLLTSNVFRKIGGQWKMVHRHASWHPETAAAQEAMKAKPGIVLYDEKGHAKSDASKDNSSKKEGMTLRKLKGDGTSKRPLGLPSVPTSLEGLDANAVLGIPMPKEEEPKKSKGTSEDGMIGKIINLSDLLGGGSESSGVEDEDKGIGDALADMLMGSADSDSTGTTGSGTPEDPFVTRRVIKIGPDGIEDLMGKKNKKPEEDEVKDVVVDLRGKSEEERKEVLSQLVDGALQDAGIQDASVSQSSQDDIRQKCISTLRKLSDQGLLSSKQKRMLLTDIITSSARGESSMVEVAYELLVTGEENDESMEDFTEQCRVFAGDEDIR